MLVQRAVRVQRDVYLSVFPHGDDVHAVFCADIQLPDALAAPFARRLQLGNAAVRRKLDKVQNARRGQRLRQLNAGFTFRHDDMICPDLFQRPALCFVGGLAHDALHAQLLEVQRRNDARSQIAADGDDSAVVIAHAERAQCVLIPHVAHGGAGDFALYPLHKLRPKINRQYLAPKLIQPLCDRTAEASKSNYNICFFHGFTPFVCV